MFYKYTLYNINRNIPIRIYHRKNIIISLEILAIFNQVIDNVSHCRW